MSAFPLEPTGRLPVPAARAAWLDQTRSTAAAAAATTTDAGSAPRRDIREFEDVRRLAVDDRHEPRRETRAGPYERRLSHGHDSAFVAQWLAQEGEEQPASGLAHAMAAARYPSLDFRDDIILPGQVTGAPSAGPCIDIFA